MLCVKNTTNPDRITSTLLDKSVGYLAINGRSNQGNQMKYGHGWPRLRTVWRQVSARLPQFCCFCHRKTDTGYDLCRFCQSHLPPIVAKTTRKEPSSVCLRCGFVWPDAIRRSKCAHCVNYRTGFDRVISPYRYDFPIDGLIQRLKYQHNLPTGQLLGCLLASEVTNQLHITEYPDVLLPVPLHAVRYRERGFNHAAEIAHWCGQVLGIDCYSHLVERRFDTGSLAGLSRAERGLNIRGAFLVSDNNQRQTSLHGLTVAIVDDVLTTGATAGELATELLDNGVAEAQLWTVARTPVTGTAGGA